MRSEVRLVKLLKELEGKLYGTCVGSWLARPIGWIDPKNSDLISEII